MRRRGRIVRWGKWAATVCAVFVLVLWVGSAYWMIELGPIKQTIILVVHRGAFCGVQVESIGDISVPSRFAIKQGPPGVPFLWWPILEVPHDCRVPSIQVAPWPIVFALSVVAMWLWYLDRRYAPGQCRACGYDLTLNESGVCPECGAKLVPQEAVG